MTDPTAALAAVIAFLNPGHTKTALHAAITAAELLPDELQGVLDYVRRHPEAVRTGPDDSPPGLRRILEQIAALPPEASAPPRCAGCGKERRLRYRAPNGGRWCLDLPR